MVELSVGLKLCTAPSHYHKYLDEIAYHFNNLFLGDTFTYEDINRNALQYVHDGSGTTEDSMEIAVTDGITSTTTLVKIVISLANDNGPRLVPGCLLSITVASKSSAIITRTNLAYMVSLLFCFLFYTHFGKQFNVINRKI